MNGDRYLPGSVVKMAEKTRPKFLSVVLNLYACAYKFWSTKTKVRCGYVLPARFQVHYNHATVSWWPSLGHRSFAIRDGLKNFALSCHYFSELK